MKDCRVDYRTKDTTHNAEVKGDNLFEIVASAASLFRNWGLDIQPDQLFRVEMAESGAIHFITLQQVEAFGSGRGPIGARMLQRKERVQCLLSGESRHSEQSADNPGFSRERTNRAATLVLEKTLGGYRALCLNHHDCHDLAVELPTDHMVMEWLESKGAHRAQVIKAIDKTLTDGKAVISLGYKRK